MKIFPWIKLAVLTVFIATQPLSAQSVNNNNAGTVMTLSLSEAQQYAIEHNATVKNASLDVQKAEWAKWQSIAGMLPSVSASLDYNNMCGYSMDFGSMSIAMNPYGTLGVTTSMAVTGAQVVNVVISELTRQMMDITRQQTEQSVNSQVKNVYVSILVMEETASLLDSTLANMERLQRSTDASVRAGAAEQTDADKLAVQVASIHNNINSTKRSIALLYNSLILQLGADVNTEFELTTPLDEILNLKTATLLLQDSFDIKQNYDYQLLKKNEALSEKQVLLSYMSYVPTLSLYHTYSNKTYFGKDEGMNMTPPNVVGATLSIPLFQSGSRVSSVKQAKINYQETMNSLKASEDGLRVQYNQLRFNLISALEDYRIQDANLDVTHRVFNNIMEKYKYGQASSLEVTNASTDLITAQSNYIQSIVSVITAQIELDNLLNK